MDINPAQFDAVSKKITEGLTATQGKIDQIMPAFQAAFDHFYIPDQVKDLVRKLCDKLVELGKAFLDKVIEVVKGLAAPLRFFQFAGDWNEVAGIVNSAAGQLKPEVRLTDSHWKGSAADRYKVVTGVQINAMEAIGTISTKVADILTTLARTGLVFYIGIAGLVAQVTGVLAGAVVAIASGVGAAPGAGTAIANTTVNLAALGTAVKAMVDFINDQANAITALNAMAVDASKFPGGYWPDPTTSTFNDGSVVDGEAEWSFKN